MNSDKIDIPKSFFSRYETRRGFFRDMGITSTAAIAASIGVNGCAKRQSLSESVLAPAAELTESSSVSFAHGGDRREMIFETLRPFCDEMKTAIADKQVIIKLNCVGQNGHPLMVTHPDAVRAVLDFLKPIYDRQVILAESTVQNKNPEKTFDILATVPSNVNIMPV